MRRRILLLSVGMTALVLVAFAVPLSLLLRSSTADESKEKARYRAERWPTTSATRTAPPTTSRPISKDSPKTGPADLGPPA